MPETHDRFTQVYVVVPAYNEADVIASTKALLGA